MFWFSDVEEAYWQAGYVRAMSVMKDKYRMRSALVIPRNHVCDRQTSVMITTYIERKYPIAVMHLLL